MTRQQQLDAIRAHAQPLRDLDDVAPIVDAIGDARVVLLGEASHGTREFYRLRGELTRALIETCGFDAVAVEADWPSALREPVGAGRRQRPLGARGARRLRALSALDVAQSRSRALARLAARAQPATRRPGRAGRFLRPRSVQLARIDGRRRALPRRRR